MTLDSNILIALLLGEERVVQEVESWQREGRLLLVSSVSVAEVLAYPALTADDIEKTKKFLRGFLVVNFDEERAGKAAELRRQYRLELPDAAIVATALLSRTPLVTRDKKLLKLPELSIVTL